MAIKYRLIIQEIEGKKHKYIYNVMFKSKFIDSIIKKIQIILQYEIQLAKDDFITYLLKRHRNKLEKEFDYSDKGKDISKKEYFKNETRE